MGHPVLELYYYDSCPFCQRVLNVIDQLKIKVEYRDVLEHAEYREKLVRDTGRRTVPCLYIDGRPMHESADIIRWLRDHNAELEKVTP